MPMLDEALHLFDRSPTPGKRAAAILAVLVHGLLALFLIYGIRWQSTMPEAVEVELVRSGPPLPAVKPAPAPKPEPEPKPVPKPEPKPQPKPEPKVEAKPPVKPDIAVKEKEKKPEPKYDPMQEMLKKEAEQQKQKQLREMLAQEEASNRATQTAQQASAAKSKNQATYAGKIRDKVRGYLMVPPGATGNPEAEFLVTQLPSGEVIEVKLRKSTGQKALDEAIERAIRKSSPLPLPDRKEDFERNLEFKFRPLDQMTAN